MKRMMCNVTILICCFLCISCTEENGLLEENVTALLETRSSPVIVTECWDAYVVVGEVSVYKGTTCQSYYVGGGGAPPGGGNSYPPGGFPDYGTAKDEGSRGGSGYRQFYVGDKWIFNFPKLSSIYHPSSTLDVAQKSHLECVMETFGLMPADYTKLLNKLVNKQIQIKFSVDKNSPYPAFFKAGKNEIIFDVSSSINWHNFIEELVHAVQYDVYGEVMISAIKNFEFEAKVFIDLVNTFAVNHDTNTTTIEYRPTLSDPDPDFIKEYCDWIKSFLFKNSFSGNDYDTYFELCEMWSGAPGVCYHGLQPQLIQEFFQKPRPPVNPNK